MKDSNIAILLARLDSQRLPKKHFEKIGEEFVITHCLNRLRLGKNYTVVLATSDREIDAPLVEWAKSQNLNVYCGNASDIKDRIKGCIQEFGAERFARVNADSPFVDAKLIEQGFDYIKRSNFDLFTNLYLRTYPYGYSVEVFNSKSFLNAIHMNKELENVTTYFYNNSQEFKIKNISLTDANYSKISLTVDTIEDLNKIRSWYDQNPKLFNLSLEELMHFIKKIKNKKI